MSSGTLRHLNVSKNGFFGGFPSGIVKLQQFKVLDLHLNGLWGDVSVLFSEFTNVEHVDLSFNKFFGSVLVDVVNISGLANTVQFVNLSHNNLSGGFFSADAVVLFSELKSFGFG